MTTLTKPVLPHPPRRVPLLGDVLGVSARTPVQDSLRLARLLGPIYTRKVFDREVVIVTGADLVADLSDERRFTKHLAPAVAALRRVGGDGLFTAYSHEPNWRAAHDLLVPAFTQAAMRRYHPVMVEVAEQLVETWDRASGPVDVTADMTKLTLETIGRTGFGYSFDSFRRTRPHPFVSAMFGGLGHARRVIMRPPVVGGLLGRRADRRNEENVAYLKQVVDEVIAARGPGGGDDLLGLMLAADTLDPVNIRNQVITFLVAGHETTSGALSFALYYLARHPEVLARARAEVDEVWGDGEPGFDQVAKLRYTRRALDESLRLWPTAPGYARAAREDTVLAGKYPMRAGEWVIVLVPGLHRDPVWGPDVEVYDPDRFLPAQVKARPPHAFKPFGTGERACIGRQFALHEATLVLGTVLRRYDLRPEPGYRLRVQELLTLKPEGFRLTVTRR